MTWARPTMTESDIAIAGASSTTPQEATPTTNAPREYPISPEGRRQAIVLLLGVASLWVFAVWSLINLFEGGLGGIEWVSLALMLGIVLVAPVVGWALLEEAKSRITTDESGLRYQSLAGVDLHYKWNELSGIQPTDRKGKIARFFLGDDDKEPSVQESSEVDAEEDDAEPDTTSVLLNTPDHTTQIKNPLARILHKLSHGATLPLYGGLERRDELLGEIASRLSSP